MTMCACLLKPAVFVSPGEGGCKCPDPDAGNGASALGARVSALSVFQLSSASCVQRIFISSLLLSYSSSGPFPGDNLATHRKWQWQ